MSSSNSVLKKSDSQQRSSRGKKPKGKFELAFKRVGYYLRSQAQEQSHSALYLSPADNSRPSRTHLTEQELWTNSRESPPSYLLSQSIDRSRYSSVTMESESAAEPGLFQNMTRHQYASDNILQSYDVLIPTRPAEPENKTGSQPGYFLVFIHGGYFRDPKVTSTSFKPVISTLESQTVASTKIIGYASLNYRLSPHPAYPQDPSTTPAYTLNNARWPNHLDDILAALKHIQTTYPQANNYILAGHSVGATLSLLTALRSKNMGIVAPAAVIGLAGIYDFPLIHKTNPDYEGMTRNAMKEDQYVEASSALQSLDSYSKDWNVKPQNTQSSASDQNRVVLLAHSRGDELLRWDQVEAMYDVFEKGDQESHSQRQNDEQVMQSGEGKNELRHNKRVDLDGFHVELIEVHGTHFDVVDNGELAKVFVRALDILVP